MPTIKRKNINLNNFIYIFLNSNDHYERTIDKAFIDYREDIIVLSIDHEDIWEVFKKTQYQDSPQYEIYERGAFEDYMGYWVKVNNFVLDYNQEFEYKVKEVKSKRKVKE